MTEVGMSAQSPAVNAQDASLLADRTFLDDLRRQMLRFATLQLSDAHLAEDAVQDALVGALRNARSFGGRAALKTWVFAILKHKIADLLRQKQRSGIVQSSNNDDEEEDLSELFNARGHWTAEERPEPWAAPEESVLADQFWKVFEVCLDNLPPKQGRVFMMREFIELESDEICVAAEITVSNLNVLLHRARMRLRECLENRWFAEGERPC